MQPDEIRFLYAYDRWATRKVLAALDGLDPAVWERANVIDERGLGSILVHQLGAAQRWRHGFQDTGEEPRPELEPLPTIEELRKRWEREWREVDAWLGTLTAWSTRSTTGFPCGRCLSTSPTMARSIVARRPRC
jgi:uncharacterized damage-inducible protein DinB